MDEMKKAIKILEECIDAWKECGTSKAYSIMLGVREVLGLLRRQPQWVSVKVSKPKSVGNKVIVYLEHKDLVPQIGYGHYEKYMGEEMWYDLEHGDQFSARGYTVTHWMPMPTSPGGARLTLY